MPAFSEDQINEAKERVRRMHARAGSYLPREEPPQGHNNRQTAPPPGKEKASPAAPNPEEPASENEGDDNAVILMLLLLLLQTAYQLEGWPLCFGCLFCRFFLNAALDAVKSPTV